MNRIGPNLRTLILLKGQVSSGKTGRWRNFYLSIFFNESRK